MGSGHGAMARPAVSEPTGVQHKAHLHFNPEGEATLQVPELDVFLEQEGVSYTDRSTWDVLRFVYQIGGLSSAKETLNLIRDRRSKVAPILETQQHREEPDPDYDEPYEEKPKHLHVSPVRKRRSSHQRPPSSSESSSSAEDRYKEEIIMQRQRDTEKFTSSVPNSPMNRLIQPLHRNSQEIEKEIDDGWTSVRSSTDTTTDVAHGRPVSKVWKRPMTSEVHEDLVRALRERSRESLEVGVVTENSESLSSLAES